MRRQCYYAYILASRSRVLYTGMTSDLLQRVYQHRRGMVPGFTRRFKVHFLVYYETTPNSRAAATRERQIKGWSRVKRIELIEATNPGWLDLEVDWYGTTSD